MSLQVTIYNRQRQMSIDKSWLKDISRRIADIVIADLKVRPAPHLPMPLISELEQRGTVNLVLVSKERNHQLNRQWRNKDYIPTVLSFSFGLEEGADQQTSEIGEVFISPEAAAEEASARRLSFEELVAELFAHGLLHVLRFDHQTEPERAEMLPRQAEVLQAIGLYSTNSKLHDRLTGKLW